MRTFRALSGLAALAVGAAVAVGCASSAPAEGIGEGERGITKTNISSMAIGSVPVDALTRRFDLRSVEEVSPVRDTVSATVEVVWNLVPQAYVDLGIPLAGVNPDARLLGNTGFRARETLGDLRISELVDCGRTIAGDIADRYHVYFHVLTQVKEADGEAVVVSVVDATARPTGVGGHAVQCSSRGRLEREILTRIRSHLVGIE